MTTEMNAPSKVRITFEEFGADGNAFALMGVFRKHAQQQGWNEAEIEQVLDQAKSSNYDNLLATLGDNIDFIDDEEV